MTALINEKGITIRELKELVKDLPEKNEDGTDFEVWIMDTKEKYISHVCTKIFQLNRGDIVLEI